MVIERTCLAIVLAAGEGTRMRSARPKVLHRIAGQSLLAHVLDAVSKAGGNATAVVVGPNSDTVATEAKRVLRGVRSSCRQNAAGPPTPYWRQGTRSRVLLTTFS